eukprot:TRINITY_DN4282_c5_g1_i1.p1 TRINITY_DN4282_c5_g1~~TRINITY_DN4282_c5_g1_i1.p1  ORF type:complete len:2113 (-),score=388.07 TRINITY_DN4282_c5_g1_i1:79-6417(-)
MRCPFLLLVCAFSLVTATIVPPITRAENWEQFHVDGGCFNDVYLYDEDTPTDARVNLNTRIMVLGDFSLPDNETTIKNAYLTEYYTLANFLQELGAQAFPVSYYETFAMDTETSTNSKFYANSVKGQYVSYNPLSGATDTGDSNSDGNFNNVGCSCPASLVTAIMKDYNTVVTQMNDTTNILKYKDATYLAGIKAIVDKVTVCAVQDKCFFVVNRVNSVSFTDNFTAVIRPLTLKGWQILTLDGLVYHTAGVATGLASQPATRFAHMLPENSFAPKPELAGAKLVQAIRGDTSACMSFGAHQVYTFDGFGYDQQQLGDFVLAKDVFNGTFEVQIRNEYCGGSGSDAPNVVCTTGVAMRIAGRTLALHYDRNADLLAVVVDGELHDPGYLKYKEFEAFIIRKQPSGFEFGLFTSGDAPFTYVRGQFSYFASVAVYPAPSLKYGVVGLCGTYDSCNLDEFYTVDNKFVEDVDTFANSWFVHGGESLFEASKYIDTDTPFIMHPPFFPPTWTAWTPDPDAVSGTDITKCKHFGSAGNFFYDTCLALLQLQSSVPADDMSDIATVFPNNVGFQDLALWNALADVCPDMCRTGYSRMAFTNTNVNCSYICDWQMSDFEGLAFGFPDTTNTSPDYRIDLPVSDNALGWSSFFYPPMGGDYLIRVRSYDCCEESASLEYYVSVNCLNSRVLVNIPTVDAARTTYGSFEVNEFSLPLIELSSELEDSEPATEQLVHVAWEFLAWPPGSNKPVMYNDFSFYPSFIPQAAGKYTVQVVVTDGCSVSADVAIVEVKCYSRDYTLSSQSSDSMIFEQSQEWWLSNYTTSYLKLADDCLAPIATTTAQKFTEFPWTFAPIAWTRDLVRADSDANVLKTNAVFTDASNKHWELYWQILEQYGIVRAINKFSNNGITNKTNWVNTTFPTTVPQSAAEMQTEYGVIRAEARMSVKECKTAWTTTITGSYTTFRYIRSVECWVFSTITYSDPEGDGSYQSSIAFNAHPAYQSDVDVVGTTFKAQTYYSWDKNQDVKYSFGWDQISKNNYDWLLEKNTTGYKYAAYLKYIHDNEFFHTGHCPGSYQLTVTMTDSFACDSGRDSYLLSATGIRRPMPLPIMPCFIIYFDYQISGRTGAYPKAYLMGYDSVVPAWRNMDFQWVVFDMLDGKAYSTIYDAPILSTTQISANWWDFDVTSDAPSDWLNFQFSRMTRANSSNYQLDHNYRSMPDVYQAVLYSTDHNMNAHESVQVWFQCRQFPKVTLSLYTAVEQTQYSTNGYPIPSDTDGVQLFWNSSTAQAAQYGAKLAYGMSQCLCTNPADLLAWRAKYAGLTSWMSTSFGCKCAITSNTYGYGATFTAPLAGTYPVELRLFDQCSWNNDTTSLTSKCDTTHSGDTFSISDGTTTNPSTRTISWTSSGSWEAVTLTATGAGTGASDWSFAVCRVNSNHSIWYGSNGKAVCANSATVTLGSFMNATNGATLYLVFVGYDKCQIQERYITINFVCPTTLIPAIPNFSLSSITGTYGGSTVTYSRMYGFNASLYTVTLAPSSTLSTTYAPVWHIWVNDFADDLDQWNSQTYYYSTCAWKYYSDPRYTVASGKAPVITPTSSGTNYQFSLAGCDFDQVNSVNLQVCETDGCLTKCSNVVNIPIYCRWDFAVQPVVTLETDYWSYVSQNCRDGSCNTAVTFTDNLAVTWANGEFPTVCQWVPYDATHFSWTWPAAWYNWAQSAGGATALTPKWNYLKWDWDNDNWDVDNCNWHDCVYYHLWDFTEVTPIDSVYQTGWSDAWSVVSPAVVGSGTMIPKKYGTDLDPCSAMRSQTLYSWVWGKTEASIDKDCGAGYYMTYNTKTVQNVTYQLYTYTKLVSGWNNDYAYDYKSAVGAAAPIYNANDDRENAFLGTCFRPDVDGTYTLRLQAWDGCWHRQQIKTVTVNAQCGAAPVVNVDTVTGATIGERYAFKATATDANDDSNNLAYQWSLWTCSDAAGLIEDLSDYVTNAHALGASFIPTVSGKHCFTLTVDDNCNAKTVYSGSFVVGCTATGVAPVPISPKDADGNNQIYTIYDFDGLGTIPVNELVENEDQDVTFHWKIIGFNPRYATWEDAYPSGRRVMEVNTNAGAFATPLVALLALLGLVLLF